MKYAYADPPYLGCCKLFDHHHPDGRCWDDPDTHQRLVTKLCTDYPDGWALSASSPSLSTILPMCPPDTRIGVWVKTFCAFKRGVRPAYAWEPILFRGGRNPPAQSHPPPERNGKQTTPKDFVSSPITLRKGLTGAKPPAVCDWILDLLNMTRDDALDDLYPGTGIMGERVRERLGLVRQPEAAR